MSLQAEQAAGTAGADDDVAELLGLAQQAALGGDGIDQLLVVRRRFLADLAGGVLGILGADRVGDLGRGQAELRHGSGLSQTRIE